MSTSLGIKDKVGGGKSITVNGFEKVVLTESGVTFPDPIKSDTPASNTGEAVLYEQAFGVGQTLQDLTGSRALNTWYTNSTGKTIDVYVSIGSMTSTGHGLYFAFQGFSGVPALVRLPTGGSSLSLPCSIPPGVMFRVIAESGTLSQWLEYR